jgi:hypothetical protein
MDRRAFLKTGLLSGSILIIGTSLYGCADLDILETDLIDDEITVALTALLPVFLAGALPEQQPQRSQSIQDTIDGMSRAMERLPPHTLDELKDLFGLLTNRLTMLAYVGSFARLDELTTEQAALLIEGWRTSYIGLLNTAYEGLKELVFAAFYGNPRHWTVMNYNKPDLGV